MRGAEMRAGKKLELKYLDCWSKGGEGKSSRQRASNVSSGDVASSSVKANLKRK